MWVVGLVDSRQVTTAGGRPAGGPAVAVVTHITGRDASRSSSAGVAAISSYYSYKEVEEGGGGGGGGGGVFFGNKIIV